MVLGAPVLIKSGPGLSLAEAIAAGRSLDGADQGQGPAAIASGAGHERHQSRATMATSRADPGKVIGLLKDPVTWPRWSTFESASSVAMVRDARGRAPHHEDPHP